MRIVLTLLRGTGEPVDLAVTVRPGATVADLAHHLSSADPAGGAAPAAPAGTPALTLRVHTTGSSGRDLPPGLPAADVVPAGSVVSLTAGGATTGAAATGQVRFTRSPVLSPRFRGAEVEAPAPPEPRRPVKVPLVMLLLPAALAPVLLLSGRSAVSLVLLVMMPLMALGTYGDQRLSSRRAHRTAVEQFTREVAAARAELERHREQEVRGRCAEHPGVADLLDAAARLSPLLWMRRPEHERFLELRAGLGSMPSRTQVRLPARGRAAPEHWASLRRLAEDFEDVAGVPVTVALRGCGALGVAGPRQVVDAVARAQLVQLVALHSPAEVSLVVVASEASARRWAWTVWLPHLGSAHCPVPGPHSATDPAGAGRLVADLEALVRRRSAGRTGATHLVVVVVEDDAPADRARLVRLAESGPAAGVHVVWCAGTVARLPAACRAFLEVTAPGAAVVGSTDQDGPARPVVCETVSEAEAAALARRLAAVVDAGAVVDGATDLPTAVPYAALLPVELDDDGRALARRWREDAVRPTEQGRATAADRTLEAAVGMTGAGVLTLDLRSQGPHALVGGTTGSGKSELLQAWVLGMATAHSPERVTFLLVDYKGGAAFADCVRLPHTVGLVTDLTPPLVRRALTSLRAELRHREQLLARKHAKDLVSLERTGDPETPPSLVVVVDEFAALAREVPEFLDGVVDVAQRGRSLGLHLVLATQRPAGAITDNLRANMNLRVSLRVADEADSTDVLGLPLAAHFDPALPGRGAVRTGAGRPVVFQTGYAGAPSAPGGAATAPVTAETLTLGPRTPWRLPAPAPSVARPAADLPRIVSAVRAAAERHGAPAPRRPWLPALPEVVELAEVVDLATAGSSSDAAMVLGVVDDPAHQRQGPHVYRPDVAGNLAVYGAGGSGRSTVLRTLATAAVLGDGGPVHVYALDLGAGALAALDPLPHVGAVVPGQDTEGVQRLVRQLHQTVGERSARYATARAATIEDYRQATGRHDEPRVLLLVDGFAALRAGWEGDLRLAPDYRTLLQVLSDGRSVGVHAALTADRPGALPAAVHATVGHTLVLRQPDESSYRVLGVPADVLSATSPPGRGLTGEGLEMQVAVLGGSPSLAQQADAVTRLARTLDVPRAPAVRRLPPRIRPDDVPADLAGRPVLGVAEDTLEPVGFAPAGTFLLAGPPRSGRTTAVRWMAESIMAAEPATQLVYLGARRSALPALTVWERRATGAAQVAHAAQELVAVVSEPPAPDEPGVVVVVEDLPDFLAGPAERPLTELIHAVKRNGHLVIADGDVGAWAAGGALLTEVRSGRRGMVLQPESIDGDTLLRTSFPRVQRREFPPGRGLVVDRGTVRGVQLPLAGEDQGPGPSSFADGGPGPWSAR